MMCSELCPGSVVVAADLQRKDEHACRLRAGHDGVRFTLVLIKTAFSAASLHSAFCIGVAMLQVRDDDHGFVLTMPHGALLCRVNRCISLRFGGCVRYW